MQATARSKHFNSDLAEVVVFARSATSSTWSMSVVVCAGYRLLLAFASVTLFLSLNILTFKACSLGRE